MRSAMGQGARLVALLSLMGTGCSGGNTSGTNRTIGSADAGRDAQPSERDADDDPQADDAGGDEEPDTGAGAVDASSDTDAAAPMDAASEADVTVGPDATSEAETGVPDAAGSEAGPPQDAGADTSVMPGATVPRNYLRPEDSPFAGVDFAYFYREDFEDHQLNTPGLLSVTGPTSSQAAGVLSSSFGTTLIDSVDGDDGVLNDNRCVKTDGYCDAWWGPGALTFRFDVEVLAALPTHVGAVWTDGQGEVSFEAFGPDGGTLYKVGPISEPGFPDDTVNSSTSEDRFFGAHDPAGISAITVSNTAGGVEVDHVQYGRAR